MAAALDHVLHHLRQLLAAEQASPGTDRLLVERFAERRDEEAFATLVYRHGAMVLNWWRRNWFDLASLSTIVNDPKQAGCQLLALQ